jgi:hypothetical protein
MEGSSERGCRERNASSRHLSWASITHTCSTGEGRDGVSPEPAEGDAARTNLARPPRSPSPCVGLPAVVAHTPPAAHPAVSGCRPSSRKRRRLVPRRWPPALPASRAGRGYPAPCYFLISRSRACGGPDGYGGWV